MGNQAECGAAKICSECLGKAQDIAAMQCKLKAVYLIAPVCVRRAHSSSPGMSLQESDKRFPRSARHASAVVDPNGNMLIAIEGLA